MSMAIVEPPRPSGTPPKTGGEYGRLLIVYSQRSIVNRL